MQAKDIGDAEFLLAVRRVQLRNQQRMVRRYDRDGDRGLAVFYREHLPWATIGYASSLGDSEEAITFRREYGPFLVDYFPTVPVKVLRAKGNRLIDRGLMSGCMCGCRGDMELTTDGALFLAARKMLPR